MLYYLGIADLPSKKAHSIQEMRMCDAFVKQGEDVVYLHGQNLNNSPPIDWSQVSDYYGINAEFDIKTFPSLDNNSSLPPKIRVVSRTLPQALYLFVQYLCGNIASDDIIYARDYYPMLFATQLFKLFPKHQRPILAYEHHTPNDTRMTNLFYSEIDLVVCITKALARYTVQNNPIDSDRIVIAPDAVDPKSYDKFSQSGARNHLAIPQDANIIMYTGHLYKGKGVETLVEAASNLDATVYIVGGYTKDIDRIKHNYKIPDNVVFTGFVDPDKIPIYQTAADVLVAPYTDESRPWISPLKLFEYMAAGRPIVASDRDVLQEIVRDGENALLFEKGNPESLQQCIARILESGDLISTLSNNAKQQVKKYTWTRRANYILSKIRP